MYRAGLCTILTELARSGRLLLVESLSLESPKTKLLAQQLNALEAPKALIITDEADKNLELASRNIPNVAACDVSVADPVSLVSFDKVIMAVAAVKKFEEMLG